MQLVQTNQFSFRFLFELISSWMDLLVLNLRMIRYKLILIEWLYLSALVTCFYFLFIIQRAYVNVCSFVRLYDNFYSPWNGSNNINKKTTNKRSFLTKESNYLQYNKNEWINK